MGGSTASTVLDLIRDRVATPDAPRGRGIKVGLAVEGGGMRGIVTGGMLLALRDLGLLAAFDASYGTSSGSVNLAYTLGGANWDGVSVYYDHLTAGFVRRHHRWDPREPVLDMGYAFDEVMTHVVPIGWEQVRAAPHPSYAVLTNVDDVRSELIDMRTMGDDAMTLLKAGAWMPWLAGRPPVVHGTRFVDGGLLCPDPVYAAITDGCTHVLLLNSSPQGSWPAVPWSRPALRAVLNRWQHGLGDRYVDVRARWDRDRALAEFGRDTEIEGTTVCRVATPGGSHHVSQFTHRRDVLFDGVRVGYQAITDLFGDGSKRPYFSLTML